MSINRRKFTDEERLAILSQATQIGVTAAIREHKLSYSVFSRWKQKFMRNDPGKRVQESETKTRAALRQLNEENALLKKIIADLALELERKEENLKKINVLYGKR